MAGILTACSAGLAAAGGTSGTKILTGVSGLIAVGNSVTITNLNAVATYVTLDGSAPTTPFAGSFIIPAIAGFQRTLALPQTDPDGNQVEVVIVTLWAIGATAWSIWIEVNP
jgi:hypothetical protein